MGMPRLESAALEPKLLFTNWYLRSDRLKGSVSSKEGNIRPSLARLDSRNEDPNESRLTIDFIVSRMAQSFGNIPYLDRCRLFLWRGQDPVQGSEPLQCYVHPWNKTEM